MDKPSNTDIPREDDRRRARRAPTLRRAVLSLLAGRGSIVQGTAVDISPDGLRVSTPMRQITGSEVEVFLPPRTESGEAGLTVTGRIQWDRPEADGTWSCGIRLYEEAPPTASVSARPEVEALMARVRDELSMQALGGPEALVQLTRLKEPAAAAAPRRRTRRWAILFLLLLLLGGLAAMLLRNFGGQRPTHSTTPEQPLPEARALDLAQRDAQNHNLSAAVATFARLAKDAKSPAARIIAELGYADALRMQGRVPEARAALARALEGAGDAPREWQDLARKFRDDLAASGAAASAPPLLVDALGLLRPQPLDATEAQPPASPNLPEDIPQPESQNRDAAPTAPSTAPTAPARENHPGPAHANIRLEVSRSRYVLTVTRDGQAIASYPVGLGIDDSTPTGNFAIANKLLNPDWFNKGEAVKSGDPRNPLGKHWMGLGTAAGPTSYGIHETRESTSIGANRSRGCVRMRPEDATALFSMVDIGTPVRITD